MSRILLLNVEMNSRVLFVFLLLFSGVYSWFINKILLLDIWSFNKKY